MELNKTKKWFYYGTFASVLLILVMGSWWLYLVFTLAKKLESVQMPELKGNLIYMIQWEGLTFFVLLLVLTLALIYIFLMDNRKSRAISAFFASMGHELKTPLTSIRLQGQVIADLAKDMPGHEKLDKYVERLKQDTIRLENELEKSLQLSRLEIGGNLNPICIDLKNFISHYAKNYQLQLEMDVAEEINVFADESALGMIFKNLLENTIKHTHDGTPSAGINARLQANMVVITYQDSALFNGDINKLGQLFYKHNSPKGSGIGLYLISKLSKRMRGKFHISQQGQHLIFEIILPQGESHE